MRMRLYSLAFMDHLWTFGVTVGHKHLPVHFILNPGHVEFELDHHENIPI